MLKLIENYIFFQHVGDNGKYCILPQFPEELTDSTAASFNSTTILGRSAPIYTYTGSGPRTVAFTFTLHRDMMNDINVTNNSFGISEEDDVLEELIKTIEAAALPKYTNVTKAVNPPIIAVRIGEEIYIKGVVSGSVQKTFSGPIIDNKYAVCRIQFTVSEIDPYDSESVKTIGGFRGIDSTLDLSEIRGGMLNG